MNSDAGLSGAGRMFPGSSMQWVTPGDRGLVEVPVLAPHLEFRPVDHETGLLVSETYCAALYGQRYLDLLPLLDGTRTRREVAAALSDRHSLVEVQTALVSLATKGHVVSGAFSMNRARAAFWSAHGASPCWAEQRLEASQVSLSGDDGRLAERLAACGVQVGDGDPTLAARVTDDYLAADHEEANRRHRSSGMPWLLVKPDGVWPLFGPVFQPGEGGACWACLAHRLGGNREVENYLRGVAGDAAAVLPRASAEPFADAIRGLAATEIAKWIVLGQSALLHDHALSLEIFHLTGEHHPVMRRPQCAECGDEALHRPDRAPTPVVLRPSPKPVHNSGGLRSVPPEETLRRYRHLVSPISGVVTELRRISDAQDGWLHVYWAGSNLALKNYSMYSMRKSIRSKSSGKGSTVEQSEASALCEAIERYSGVFHGDEIRRRARFSDFAEDEALHPNDVMQFSDWQYDNAEMLNRRRSKFHNVPLRFDPEAAIDWTPVWSLTHGRHRYLPTAMLYFSKPLIEEGWYCLPDSNGCAAGNTLEEAILQGFFELVERDAFACWWYNRLRLPAVDLDSFDDPYLAGAQDYYRRANRELWVLDVTNDLGIPAFVAVSRRTDKEAEDILYSAGAHTDPKIAAFRAVCELNQCFIMVENVKDDGPGYRASDPEALWWWQHVKLADQPWLAPDGSTRPRGRSDYHVPETDDVKEDVELCRALVEGKGMEFLVLDQTRPDIGMPVAKTIVPGLRHFWARFAPGRLFDVPVAMGLLEKPCAEAALNPLRVFI